MEDDRARLSLLIAFTIEALLAMVVVTMLYRIVRTSKAPLEAESDNITRLAWFKISGVGTRSIDLRGRYILPRIAPGRHKILLTRVMPGDAAVWSLSLLTGELTRLITSRERSGFAIASPDGAEFTFSQWHDNRARPFVAAFDSSVVNPVLRTSSVEKRFSITPDDWASNGRRIVLTRRNATQTDLLILQTDREMIYPLLSLPEKAHAFDARFSPDGKWIAFTSDMTGRDEVYRVQMLSQLTGLPFRTSDFISVSEHGGCSPEWGFNGDILYINPEGELVATNWTERSPTSSGTHVIFRISDLGRFPYKYRFGGYAVDRAHSLILLPLINVSSHSHNGSPKASSPR